MFGTYERFKWNYVALRKSSDNQINTYSLDIGGLSKRIHHKGGYWNWAIRIIRILESLTVWGILLRTVGQIWFLLRACFFTLMK